MRTSTKTFAAAIVLMITAACSSDTDAVPEQEEDAATPDGMAEMEAYEDEDEGEATVGLEETHDFGDGFTIAMTDLRREVDPDGWNSVTGEEGALPYVAWSFEISNDTGGTLSTGSVTSSCFTGDPLEEAEQPVLGDSVNPPDQLADGQSGAWDLDCWMDESESQMQYTLQFHDEQGGEMYPPVTFAGEVPAE